MQILKDEKICFSGILCKGQTLKNHPFYIRAVQLGATVLETFFSEEGNEIKITQRPTCILSREYSKTKKLMLAKKYNIPIVHVNWLDYSFLYSIKLKWEPFNLLINTKQ